MATIHCVCGDKQQEGCSVPCEGEKLPYWCESCERSVPEKRCPFCGLKARKKRQAEFS